MQKSDRGNRNKGRSYVIPVKENQPGFLRAIKEKVKELEESGEIKELDFAENVNKGHGRIEKYRLARRAGHMW